jgi:hypothetical protein
VHESWADFVALSSTTSAVLDAATGNVEITVEWRDRQQAVDAANAIAAVLVRRFGQDQLVAGEAGGLQDRGQAADPAVDGASGLAAALAAVLAWTVVKARPRMRRASLIRPRSRSG